MSFKQINNIKKANNLVYELKGNLDNWKFQGLLFSLLFLRKQEKQEWEKLVKAVKEDNLNISITQYINNLFDSLNYQWINRYIDFDNTFEFIKEEKQKHILVELIKGINKFELSEDSDDFGQLYSALIFNFATTAGKQGGEFFTPQCLSQLIRSLIDIKKGSVYDPTCGSGSLLTAFKDGDFELYGQELNFNSYCLARMNLLCHGFDGTNIKMGDTIHEDQFKDSKFDIIVANPPFSLKNDPNKPIYKTDERFKDWIIPSKLDLVFVAHCLSKLKDNGKCLMLCFTGAIYREGKEAQFRKQLLDRGNIEAVILLPENLFFSTTIAPVLLILSKAPKKGVLFIDATKEYSKKTKQHLLEPEHIEKIKKTYFDYLHSESNFKEIIDFAKYVSNENIEPGLHPQKYIEYTETEKRITKEEVIWSRSYCVCAALLRLCQEKKLIGIIHNEYKEDLLQSEKDYLKFMEESKWIFEKYQIEEMMKVRGEEREKLKIKVLEGIDKIKAC